MDGLKEFITASLSRKTPKNFPVSHPDRGFDIITEKMWEIWEQWGWQKESWDSVVEAPKGAKRTRRRTKEE